jgi:hypothetical protein
LSWLSSCARILRVSDGVCHHNPAKINCFGGANECEGVTWERSSGFRTSGQVTCQKAHHGGRSWSFWRGYKNEGVVAAILALSGSIGYAVLADAVAASLSYSRIVNAAGTTVQATDEAISYAVLELGGNVLDLGGRRASRAQADLTDAYSTFAWPIVGYTYFVLRKGMVNGVSYMEVRRGERGSLTHTQTCVLRCRAPRRAPSNA